MSTRIVVVGAGGFGRELISWLTTSPRWMAEHGVCEIVAIDDDEPAVAMPVEIVSTVRDFSPEASDLGVCAIGSPGTRLRVVKNLEHRGLAFAPFVHDSAIVGDNVSIARGAVICPSVVLTCNIKIGAHVHVNCACTIGHDVTINSFATLSSACNLSGGVHIGSRAFLGTAVTVIPTKRVGADSYVGAGSVVIRDVGIGTTVFGNPATRVRGA